jgi:hypothetical protein
MDIDRELLLLMILDVNNKIVLEPSTGVIEHGYGNFLCLFFMQ